MSWNKRVLAGLWGILRPLDFFEKVDLEVEWQKKNFSNKHDWCGSNNVSGVFSHKKIFLTKTPPLVGTNPKFFFLSKTVKNTFWALFGWFYMILCFGKKKYLFWQKVSFGESQSKAKNFFYFFGRFELPKCKVWVFFGVLIFNFLSTMTGSQGQFRWPKLKNKNFKINYFEWS